MSMQASMIRKHSIQIDGHRTAVSMEDEFWDRLRHAAIDRHTTITELVKTIDRERNHRNLSSAVRLFVLKQCS